jgi:hypothetical protein
MPTSNITPISAHEWTQVASDSEAGFLCSCRVNFEFATTADATAPATAMQGHPCAALNAIGRGVTGGGFVWVRAVSQKPEVFAVTK